MTIHYTGKYMYRQNILYYHSLDLIIILVQVRAMTNNLLTYLLIKFSTIF